jgi:hypothetical protein
VVELRGFEPLTFSLRTRRATNCAIAPSALRPVESSTGLRVRNKPLARVARVPPGAVPTLACGRLDAAEEGNRWDKRALIFGARTDGVRVPLPWRLVQPRMGIPVVLRQHEQGRLRCSFASHW